MKKALICLVMASSSSFGAAYHLIKQIPIPGNEPGWDYVTMDSENRNLYISRSTHVLVLNVDSGQVVADIKNTAGVHGIALAPGIDRGYVSCGRANQVAIFGIKKHNPLGTVATGKNPDAIVWDEFSKRFFTFNGGSKDATAIGGDDGEVEGTIPLGAKPEFAAPDGNGRIYVNLEDTSEVAEIDSKKMTVLRKIGIAPCESPSGMAMDRKNRRLFLGCENKMMAVVDADAGKVIATIPIGSGVDANGFDPGTGLAFSSNGEGTLTVAKETSPGKWEAIQTVPTQRSARTMAVDLKTHNIYLPAAKFGPPPAATAENPHPWPSMIPGTFVILVVGSK